MRKTGKKTVHRKHVKVSQAAEMNDNQRQHYVNTTENFIVTQDMPRSFWKRLSDNLSYSKYVIILLFIPPILNLGALQKEAVALLPKGRKVDMGWGQKMYIHCEGSGLPTVILDAPTGMNSDIWLFIQEQIAEITKVCVYDRAGIGSSDAAFSDVSSEKNFALTKRFVAQPSTITQMTSDLYYLVKQANQLPSPFILVGAEIGALIARMFSIMHTEDVSGIVLIDPLVENLFSENSVWEEYWHSRLLASYQALQLSAAVGLSRIAFLLGLLQPSFFMEKIPEDIIHRQKSLLCNPWHLSSALYECLLMNTSFAQMSDAWGMREFPQNISVSVISREQPSELPPSVFEVWKKSQKYLVSQLHQHCHNTVVTESNFYKLYSKSTPITAEIEKAISYWRRKHDGFPSFAQ